MLVHAIQVHRLTRRPIHVDLFAVRMTEELTVEVQLVGTGTAPAGESGGTLVHPVSSVKVRALPDNLPETLHYDLSALVDYDSTITVADLLVPEGVTSRPSPRRSSPASWRRASRRSSPRSPRSRPRPVPTRRRAAAEG